MTKIAIVGGVAGGATVASQIRRLNKDAEITIYDATMRFHTVLVVCLIILAVRSVVGISYLT